MTTEDLLKEHVGLNSRWICYCSATGEPPIDAPDGWGFRFQMWLRDRYQEFFEKTGWRRDNYPCGSKENGGVNFYEEFDKWLLERSEQLRKENNK